MKTTRIPFSLELYKSGKYKVITKLGNKVRIVCTDLKSDRNIIALVKLFNSNGELILRANNKGEANIKPGLDLVLEKDVFEDGDILTMKYSDVFLVFPYRGTGESGGVMTEAYYSTRDKSMHYFKDKPRSGCGCTEGCHLSTEVEKQLFITTLESDGKQWDEQEKCIKDIRKECKLEPFQKVLVRDYDYTTWKPRLFGYYVGDEKFPYRCVGSSYIQCIPYEGNENLLGTTNKPKI